MKKHQRVRRFQWARLKPARRTNISQKSSS